MECLRFNYYRARLVASDGASKSRLEADPSTHNSKPGTNGADNVIVDPTKGGAVDAKTSQQSEELEVQPGELVWDDVVRRGAAMGLREVLKIQGKCDGMRGERIYLTINH